MIDRIGSLWRSIDWGRFVAWGERILPTYKDPPERRTFKLFVLLIVGMFLLMLLIGLLTFLLSLKGSEQVMVPAVEGKDLIPALIELQEKELYPRVQVRYSSDYEKGLVLEQKPAAGSSVRVGRRVTLVVSRGPVIDRVEDYVGEKLDDVRVHLQSVFASSRALLRIKEPISFVFDDSPAGTILAQKPPAGKSLDELTELELVVSRGPRGEMISVQDYAGLRFQDALAQLASANIPFTFTVRRVQGQEKSGVVVSQTPEPASEISYGSVVQLVMTRPAELLRGKVFGVFEYTLPTYPIMVDVSLDAVSPEGNTTLLAMKHPGGPIAIPYIVDAKTELVFYVLDKEEMRQAADGGR
jgi:beta-lactam-binding protein with PASTA domain